MASIWLKLLVSIAYRSKLLQTWNATIDVEVKNIESLLAVLSFIRENWDSILSEAKVIANAMNN